MCDDQGGTVLREARQGVANEPFRLAVERTRGLVQQEDGRVLRIARAKASRCRCPPDRRKPPSPIIVS